MISRTCLGRALLVPFLLVLSAVGQSGGGIPADNVPNLLKARLEPNPAKSGRAEK